MSEQLLELWQAEWCPECRAVRQRLTELGVPFVARPVPDAGEDRSELRAATGLSEIPVLVVNGQPIAGEPRILAYLDATFPEPAGAAAHRTHAARAQARQLRELERSLPYTIAGEIDGSFEDGVERVTAELQAEGFGVLTEIDVRQTLRAKLGIDTEPYVILGACNPSFAHRALAAEAELGALLPCNVIVYRQGDKTRVAAIDAERMLGIVGNSELSQLAGQVERKLTDVVRRATAASGGAPAGAPPTPASSAGMHA